MKVKQLQLQNYGRFDDLTMEFAPNNDTKGNVTIIVGNNGAGKSQILQALAAGFSWFVNNLTKESGVGDFIRNDRIKNNSEQAKIEMLAVENTQELKLSISARKQKLLSRYSSSSISRDDFSQLALDYIKNYNIGTIKNFPLIIYFGDERKDISMPKVLNESFTTNILTAYENSLNAGLSYTQFFQWFRDMEDIENEAILVGVDKNFDNEIPYIRKIQLLRLEEQEIEHNIDFSEGLEKVKMYQRLADIKSEIYLAEKKFEELSEKLSQYKSIINYKENYALSAVRVAIEYFTDFKNIRIERQGTPKMVVEKDGEKLDVNQLSQGEKSLLALVGDIARRLAILNPSLENPLQGEGVVLIDEVDLHLHPKWQQNLIDKLTKTFPNVQFILTTHSPHIVSDNPDVLVYILDNGELRPYNNAYGEDVNTLLNGVFGVSEFTPEIAEQFTEVRRAIGHKELDKAEKIIQELSNKLSPNNSELLRLQLYLAKAKLTQSKAS